MIMIVIHFSIQFGYYGLWLWFPELFNKLENFHKAYPNETISVCQVFNIFDVNVDFLKCSFLYRTFHGCAILAMSVHRILRNT
jgi:hypothetical protein